nr:MAG TPA: hypothetical protein [Caudoviricetes sp.]
MRNNHQGLKIPVICSLYHSFHVDKYMIQRVIVNFSPTFLYNIVIPFVVLGAEFFDW